MKNGPVFSNLLLLALILVLAPTAFASTTLYVNGASGSDSHNCLSPATACKTIGHAISRAASGDSVMVAPATYTENLTVSISLIVIGSGAATTIVDGGGLSEVLTISGTAKVNLSGLTIRNGHAANGGGIHNNGTLTITSSIISGNVAAFSCLVSCFPSGGGIYNNGALTITSSLLSGNKAFTQCYASQCAAMGGGIFNNSGTLVITNSTITGNGAGASCRARELCHSDGGGIFVANGTATISKSTISVNSANEAGGIDNRGTLTISDSTFHGNSAIFDFGAAHGGGIISGGATTISNSTFSGNSAEGIGSYGGAIYGNATLQNSIVANSPSGGNCYPTITSKGYNLSSDGTCKFDSTGDLNNHDPVLGPLQNNGGPTQTMALLPGSPAIDAGNPGGCTDGEGHLLKTDQRGMPRPDREDIVGCDIGAYERQSD